MQPDEHSADKLMGINKKSVYDKKKKKDEDVPEEVIPAKNFTWSYFTTLKV